MKKQPKAKRPPPGLEHARQACQRLHATGRTVTTRAVLEEVKRAHGVKISFRDACPAVQAWRAEAEARVAGRVEIAVEALLALETEIERDMLRRAVHQRTGGGIRVRLSSGVKQDLPKRAG